MPDSAATATALLCGVKTNYGTVAVSAKVQRGECSYSQAHNLTCIGELAQKAGITHSHAGITIRMQSENKEIEINLFVLL